MRYVCLVLLLAAPVVASEPLREIRYRTSADNSKQPAMFYSPQSDTPVPLLVALHTWSGNYKQTYHAACAKWCQENGWAYIHPDFRGPNKRPQATGSDLVVKDIISAVDYAKANAKIDPARIYLVGTSGGGYTALLMAGRAPEIWAGVSAWVPISDLRAWHAQCKKAGRKYHTDIAASCGGPPGTSTAVDGEYTKRSPLTFLSRAKGLALDINAGIHDGHKGSVPISHSLLAFNEVAAARHRIREADIRHFVDKQAVPPALVKPIEDATYGRKRPLFRRTSGKARVTIFEGGHELVAPAALAWLEKQRRTAPATQPPTPTTGVRLFILSGQSNMAGLDPNVSFTPTVKKAYAREEVIVVKDAQGGRPIVRWYTGNPKNPGPLYVRMMKNVRKATAGKKIKSVVFVWMQGESDAIGKGGTAAAYEKNLKGLIQQLRDDLKRPDTHVVIGRICDWRKTDGVRIVRKAQVDVAEADPLVACVDTDSVDRPKGNVHYTKKGYAQMGKLFADKAIELLKPSTPARPVRPVVPPPPPKPRTDAQRAAGKLKMAKAYLNSGRTDKGLALLAEIIKTFPDTNAARHAKQELKKLRSSP